MSTKGQKQILPTGENLQPSPLTMQSTAQPKKRRVRRQKLELDHLRRLAGELENHLALLQAKRLNRLKSVHQAGGKPTSRSKLQNDPVRPSMWMSFAARQLKERGRAVEENRKLHHLIGTQMEMASNVKTLFHKHISDRNETVETASSCQQRTSGWRFWDFSSDADDEIFADQLMIVARMRLEMANRGPWRTMDLNWDLSRGNMVVKRDPSADAGVMFEINGQTVVPFNINVTMNAYLKLFRLEHGEKPNNDSFSDVLTDVHSRSFSIRLKLEGVNTKASGKYTLRTYTSTDEVTITWVESVDVDEFGDIKFNGMQYQKRSYIKFRRVSHEGPDHASTSTVVETQSACIPVFREGVEDKLQQAHAFIDFAYRMQGKFDRIVTHTLGNLLLEEDWKATFT